MLDPPYFTLIKQAHCAYAIIYVCFIQTSRILDLDPLRSCRCATIISFLDRPILVFIKAFNHVEIFIFNPYYFYDLFITRLHNHLVHFYLAHNWYFYFLCSRYFTN